MLRSAASHAAHLLTEAVLGIAGIIGIAGCVLVWRLAQGPIDITQLVQREQYRLHSAGVHLTVGHAALAWEGFRDPDSPLDIRFSDLTIADASGTRLADIPAGRVTLAVAPLWRGALVPRTVALSDVKVALQRNEDGHLRLDVGTPTPSSGPTSGQGAVPLLGALTRPGAMPFLAELSRVHLANASVTLRDAALGVLWRAQGADIVLQRQPDGSLTTDAVLTMAVADVEARLSTHVTLSQTGMQVAAVSSAPISPATLARVLPVLQPLAAVNAPVTAAGTARFDPDFALRGATLGLAAGAGTIQAGKGSIAVTSAAVSAETDGVTAKLTNLRIVLAPPPGAHAPAPTLTGNARLSRAAGGAIVDFSVGMDRVAFADLPAYWPAGVGGGAQPWITHNITAGTAQDAKVAGQLTIDANGKLALNTLSGNLAGHDLTLFWLRPIPAIQHAEAKLTLEGPDTLHIDVTRGAQGPLSLSQGSVRITGLTRKDQLGTIATSIGGPLADVLALLNHPRLRLLSKQPLPLEHPGGQVAARLTVTLPLDDRVNLDDISIAATARLTDVHLAAIAVGRDLDDGQLDLKVDTRTLTLNGEGRVGSIPAKLGLAMDFTAGPPSQILEKLTASGRATAPQMASAGLPGGIVTAGAAGFDIAYTNLRNKTGTVEIALNLGDAAVATPFGWAKPAGPAATASARLNLTAGRLTSIDRIKADGPDLKIVSRAETNAGRPTMLVFDQLQLGRTSATGSVGLPTPTQPAWRIAFKGPALDLSSYLKRRDTSADTTADDDKPGPPWQANLTFDKVILAKDETLAPAAATFDSDGLHLLHMEVSAGPKASEVRASIEPVATGRSMKIDATDAGAVLLAAGVADNLRGGKLHVTGNFDDRAPHAPLAGTATLEQFRITDAPAMGRLLKAMTLYGAVDLLRGPGLGFQKAIVPFRWQQRVLTMEHARAFSASLGLTAAGTIDMRHHMADVTGTIVPAYFFNQLPGKIPLIGKLFSPETGGGVFAARYSVRGKLSDPKVGVNPLSALTPGFLRGIFGLF